jgi:hypothetical protein
MNTQEPLFAQSVAAQATSSHNQSQLHKLHLKPTPSPTLRYLRSTNHWAAPITVPAEREAQEGKHPPKEEPPPDRTGLVANSHDCSTPRFSVRVVGLLAGLE